MKITSDSFNPVLIKELRQSFHGKLFLAIMGLLLIAQLGAMFMIYANSVEAAKHNSVHNDMGVMLFGSVLFMYGAACFFLCGISVINRFTQERSNPELDFTRFCAMSPLEILWGKMTSSFAVAIYLFSLCLPFLVIAYFMRGISLLDMGIGVVSVIICTLFMIQLSLFIGSIGQKALAGILVFGCIWGGFGLIGFISMLIATFSHRHTATDIYALFSIAVVFSLIGLGLIFVLNLGMLSSAYANRTMPTRIYAIAIAILSPAFALLIHHFATPTIPLAEVIIPTIIIAFVIASCLCSVVAAFERSIIGPRVQRQCPQTPLKRFGFFLISSGSGGGLTLAWILQLIAFTVALATIPAFPIIASTHGHFNITARFIALSFGFCSLFYTELGLFVHKRFNILPFAAWLFVTVVLVFVPLLLGSFASIIYNTEQIVLFFVTNPFFLIILDDSGLKLNDLPIWISLFLAIVGLCFAFPYIIQQLKSLRTSSNT
ncbi:MAG: ABC transporter permease [Lentisphaeria bacterium]|nr:ABC transporter permease [Lentisphaeria bacterium]